MGGRGSSSGLARGSGGLSVTRNGETTEYYFTSRNGQNYYQRGVGGIPEPTPQNMSASEFKQRVISSGAKVSNISETERSRKEALHREDRKKSEKRLDELWHKAGPKPKKGWKGH